VPYTKGNIDHIVVAPAGVFVVDAKKYKGQIEVRGGLFGSNKRLYVGRRDCSKLADGMGWQLEAVGKVLTREGESVPLVGVLCFVDGEWPLLFPPSEFKGVRLEGKRSLGKLVVKRQVLQSDAIERLWRTLGLAFPAK
jgi:hypothetical protein